MFKCFLLNLSIMAGKKVSWTGVKSQLEEAYSGPVVRNSVREFVGCHAGKDV